MSSLVSPIQKPILSKEILQMFLKLGIFSKFYPFLSGLFSELKQIRESYEIIAFISHVIVSIKLNIQSSFYGIGIVISNEEIDNIIKFPIEIYNKLMKWYMIFTNIMNDSQRIKYYEIYHNKFIYHDELILFLKSFYSNESFRIFIKTITGNLIEIQITQQTSIEELKSIIFQKEGIPNEQQRLIFCGKQLEDSRMIGMYNIEEGSKLSLILALRGGMHHKSSTGDSKLDFDILKEELSPEIQELILTNL